MAEDLSTVCFRDPGWLSQFPLTPETVLDYFALTQFYDRTCNNELIKMQQIAWSELANMKGVEYVLHAHSPPDLFVVRKQHREGPDAVVPMAVYYIVAGTVYQAPTVGTVLSSRLRKALFFARTAFQETAKHPSFSTSTGYQWDVIKTPPTGTDTETSAVADASNVSGLVKESTSAFAAGKLARQERDANLIHHVFSSAEASKALEKISSASAAVASTPKEVASKSQVNQPETSRRPPAKRRKA